MSSYFKMKTKNPAFEELKRVNPMVTVGIIDCGEKVSCSLKRRNENTNKFYNIHLDNEINTTTEIPFLEIMDNRNIFQMGTVVLLDDELDGKAVEWLIDSWNLNSLYTILSSIMECEQQNYSLESVQTVVNNLVENSVNLTPEQQFTVRQTLNYELVKRVSADISQELIPILDNIFNGCAWDTDKNVRKLFI